ncbi:MAG: lipid-A-disaccharide synthase N-terminal domain-containing protein [Candidatus Micrarchaeia archaeon]
MADYLGIVGLVLILAGWTIELINAIRAGKSQVPLSFAVLYAAGSGLLAWHSLEIGDMVFLVLNAAATLVAVVNIVFCLFAKGKKKR